MNGELQIPASAFATTTTVPVVAIIADPDAVDDTTTAWRLPLTKRRRNLLRQHPEQQQSRHLDSWLGGKNPLPCPTVANGAVALEHLGSGNTPVFAWAVLDEASVLVASRVILCHKISGTNENIVTAQALVQFQSANNGDSVVEWSPWG